MSIGIKKVMYFCIDFVVFFIRVIFEKIEMNIYVNFKDLSMLLIRNVVFFFIGFILLILVVIVGYVDVVEILLEFGVDMEV